MSYCSSRFATLRRRSTEVAVGSVKVGASNPIRIQSMTTSDTQDVDATVRQAVALAEVGCEIVRVTAPNVPAAKCLRDIRARLSAAGFPQIPLVADIHFLPQAAMEAVEHVEKVRVNPGNYADKKKFAVRDYNDADYDRELERLHEAFSPLVLRAKALGRALRIGTNHGSLSDRIMNRYGDSPLGMVESALEFVRICEFHGFHDIVLSMKSSNPKVMIQAYRLLVSRMDAAHRAYPLHLGVTEAGDGEDGRIKGAIGIGSLLMDGIGDTIRVSLTEDSVYEIPVAQALAAKAEAAWRLPAPQVAAPADRLDPFRFERRAAGTVRLGRTVVGGEEPPRVIAPLPYPDRGDTVAAVRALEAPSLADTPAEAVLLRGHPAAAHAPEAPRGAALVVDLEAGFAPASLARLGLPSGSIVAARFLAGEDARLASLVREVRSQDLLLALDLSPADCAALGETLRAVGSESLLATISDFRAGSTHSAAHALGAYRLLAEELRRLNLPLPLWIRCTAANQVAQGTAFLSQLLEASLLAGGLLCDGLGDLLSIETEPDPVIALKLGYNVLQGAGARISKTEYVACPSCGRTLFDLQTTTQRIRTMTGHLKGVKIAIMGCIVNGPGEMADADFGYVGGAPGKINLYVGKNCVQYNIPQDEADARLMNLIREHGKWTEPKPVETHS